MPRYAMTYTDHRDRVEVMEFDAPSDREAVALARHHLGFIRSIFKEQNHAAPIRRGWFVLWIVRNVDSCAVVYQRTRN